MGVAFLNGNPLVGEEVPSDILRYKTEVTEVNENPRDADLLGGEITSSDVKKCQSDITELNHNLNDKIDELNSRFKMLSGGSFDDYKRSGLYYCNGVEDKWCFLIVIAKETQDEVKQIRFGNNTTEIYTRFYWNGYWSEWDRVH